MKHGWLVESTVSCLMDEPSPPRLVSLQGQMGTMGNNQMGNNQMTNQGGNSDLTTSQVTGGPSGQVCDV